MQYTCNYIETKGGEEFTLNYLMLYQYTNAVYARTLANFLRSKNLRKKCLYSEIFWSVFSPNAGKYEYGHISRSDLHYVGF